MSEVRRRRRRRRPFLIFVLAFALLCELEVVSTAMTVGQRLGLPWLSRGAPILALLLAVGPFIHLATMGRSFRLPGWMTNGYLVPSYLFVLSCMAHGFFGGILGVGRWTLGLGEASADAQAFGLALPFVLAAYGASTGQLWTRIERLEVPVRNLGPGLAGLRVVQLSDLHAGFMVGERRLRRIAEKVKRLQPDLVVVTGDIVNQSPHEAELIAPILGSLPAPLGVWACLGNHDHFVDGDAVDEVLTRSGVRVLRNRGEVIRRGDGAFWLAGVDDTWTNRTDLDAALRDKPEGMPTLLLAHDPNVWPQAVERKVELTLSGHTHGGQIGLVKVHPSLSLARLITPFVAGRYVREGSTLYVSRGTANTLPLRLGSPTEVGLLRLFDAPVTESESESESNEDVAGEPSVA